MSHSEPTTSVRPFQMPRKAPTVSSVSPFDNTPVENSIMTWEPPTDTTRPIGARAFDGWLSPESGSSRARLSLGMLGGLRARSVFESP
jgi:hypothetical protein